MVRVVPHIYAEMSAEPIPFDCERIVDFGFGWLITMERSDIATAKNTICLWRDRDAEDGARFYAKSFPDSSVGAVHRVYRDGIPCLGLNVGPVVNHNWA